MALSLSLPAPQYDELYRRATFYGESMSAVTRRVIVAGLRQTAPPKHGG